MPELLALGSPPGARRRFRLRPIRAGVIKVSLKPGLLFQMRILLLSAAFTPDPGGVATHVNDLAQGLLRAGHTVFVVTRHKDETPRKAGYGRLLIWKRPRKSVPEFDGRRVFCEDILSFVFENWHQIKPDIVHAHDPDSLFLAWMLKTAFGRPVMMTVHRAPSPWREGRFRESAKDCFMETARTAGLMGGIAVPSQSSAQVLREQGFGTGTDQTQVEVIPHGVRSYPSSIADDQDVVQEIKKFAPGYLIICPSRADEHKDVETFVEAAGLLKRDLPSQNLHFLLGAQETDVNYRKVRQIAKDSGLSEGHDILFKTFPYKHMPTVYRRATVCVIRSRHESFGLTVLEAFLWGVPVVAANTSALRETVTNGMNGLLFTDGDARDLAAQVRRVVVDRALRTHLRKGGAEAIGSGRHSAAAMVRRYELFYARILDR
ncbi:MAG TPA: glycosyltransferase family 4 protein [Bryobacteraceae bacterium]|nr:glycosyltransferase family 4 protein [Bryobacteraceae bacterium]